MVNDRSRLGLACALVLLACGEEEAVSIGELRCVGESIRCELPTLGGSVGDDREPDALPEQEAELVWMEELPCATDHCPTRVVIDQDGSLVIAQDSQVDAGQGAYNPQGVWLGRYDTDGALLAESEALIDRDDEPPFFGSAVLAASAEGDVVLGVLRRHDFSSSHADVTIYAVDDASEPTTLFEIADLAELSAIATAGGDLWVAGSHVGEEAEQTPAPELARYGRDGALKWRQTSLRPSPAPRAQGFAGATTGAPIPIVTRSDGRTFLAVLDSESAVNLVYALVELAPDGNVEWWTFEFTEPTFHQLLAVSTGGDLLVGHGAYVVDGYRPTGDPSSPIVRRSASRFREEYWEMTLLGLGIDGEDRVLVATQEGPREAPRLRVDRYAPDLGVRETYVVQEAEGLITQSRREWREPDSFRQLQGLAVGREGEIYVWTHARIARLELP
jgi:hypothetical protein